MEPTIKNLTTLIAHSLRGYDFAAKNATIEAIGNHVTVRFAEEQPKGMAAYMLNTIQAHVDFWFEQAPTLEDNWELWTLEPKSFVSKGNEHTLVRFSAGVRYTHPDGGSNGYDVSYVYDLTVEMLYTLSEYQEGLSH